jgi:hypothetical protein
MDFLTVYAGFGEKENISMKEEDAEVLKELHHTIKKFHRY